MKCVECATQAELDKALTNKKPDEIIVCTGGTSARPLLVSGSSTVWAYDSSTVWASDFSTVWAYDSSTVTASDASTVRAYDSSTVTASDASTVTAYGSSTVWAYDSSTVTAYDSSTVTASDASTVTAYDSSTVTASDASTVTAYDSSTVTASDASTVRAYDSSTVTAYDSSTVTAYDSSTVTASKYVAIHKHPNGRQKITGGVIIEIPPLDTPKQWLDYHGIRVERGIAILYKAVDDDWGANRNGFKYEPGSKPEAPDWDSEPRCGGGLHFCARPLVAKDLYHPQATRFVGCPVRLADLVVIDESKVKAPRVARPVFEVDRHGDPVAVEASA